MEGVVERVPDGGFGWEGPRWRVWLGGSQMKGLVGRFQGLHSNNDCTTQSALSGYNALLL